MKDPGKKIGRALLEIVGVALVDTAVRKITEHFTERVFQRRDELVIRIPVEFKGEEETFADFINCCIEEELERINGTPSRVPSNNESDPSLQ